MKTKDEILWNQINAKVKESFPNIKDGLLNFQKFLYGENIFSNKDFIRIIYSPYKDGRMVQYKTPSKEVKAYYDTYEDFESIFEQYKKDVAKAKKPSSEKCKVQIVKDQSKDELRELAEFACQLMDDPRYYNNEDKLLEKFFKYKQERETRQDSQEKDGDDLDL